MAAQNTGSTSLPSPTTPIPADASSLRCPESDLRVPEANLQPQAPPVTHTASRTGNSSELHRLVSYTHPYTPPDTPSSTTTEFFDLSPIDGDELQEHDVELEGRFDFLNVQEGGYLLLRTGTGSIAILVPRSTWREENDIQHLLRELEKLKNELIHATFARPLPTLSDFTPSNAPSSEYNNNGNPPVAANNNCANF
ncbi:hypothetical protein BU23DRAFT_575597 [Bimuria novae-zelandiae CBS 107.79]|uniref:Uncharacterized protein n=1 Tax=Bimuria novae-zelandiae CBS 107.79 TaxID=1447943 RepID=A0A6A5UI15_9PLEO|nr:hypothetical protein BU23DRAFT_575597 [Bimuria novae-zelandiae CBS 107.79]